VPGAEGEAVAAIVARVREGGDAAVRELAAEFGEATPQGLRVAAEAIAEAPARLEPAVREGLALAAANIERIAVAELDTVGGATQLELDQGQTVEIHSRPVAAAGIYAPGGRAAYPSSVLMCALPARVAGVPRIALVSPPGEDGLPHPAVLAACAIAGIDEVYAVGGAQAVAALAHGTETIAAVDVIAGPGNRYVTEAKRQLAGTVGIDGLAGPSELVIVADAGAEIEWLALDLCAQAEHGDDSPVLAICTDEGLIEPLEARVAEFAAARPSVADAPLALVLAPTLEAALELADAFAPEHLELAFAGADAGTARERVAGCVFYGEGGATAFGDYAAGSNHVLPTGGAARFGRPLGPAAFMRRGSVVGIDRAAARQLAPAVAAIATAEGLPVHGESATARASE
jgi:histidinol dehydrogenase